MPREGRGGGGLFEEIVILMIIATSDRITFIDFHTKFEQVQSRRESMRVCCETPFDHGIKVWDIYRYTFPGNGIIVHRILYSFLLTCKPALQGWSLTWKPGNIYILITLSPGQTVVPTQANSSQVYNLEGVGYRVATHLVWVGSSSNFRPTQANFSTVWLPRPTQANSRQALVTARS